MSISIIIMASGLSRRFGNTNKLNHKINGSSLIEIAIKKAINLKDLLPNVISKLLVVSCYDFIEELCKKNKVEYVYNSRSKNGQAETIKLGVLNTKDDMLFLVADMPFLNVDSLKCFIEMFIKSNKGLGSVANFSNNLGNPCIFKRKYQKELLELVGDVGGKFVIKRHLDDLYTYNISSYQLEDIDYNNEKNSH